MSVGFCIKAGGTLVELVIPWILSYIIDDLIPLGEIGPVCVWGGLMIVCSLLAWIGNIAANRMASRWLGCWWRWRKHRRLMLYRGEVQSK